MLQLERNKDLTEYNTLGFTSHAEAFIEINDEAQLVEACQFIDKQQQPYQILSGGSNLLMAPIVEGVTLHMRNKGIDVISQDQQHILLRVSAGENWHELVEYTVDNNWQGLENLALIPGLVGAAPVQNIGAYGTELKDVLIQVRAFDKKTDTFVLLENDQCQFSYRDSLFKRNNGRFIISSVDFKLSKHINIEYKYQAIQDFFTTKNITQVTLRDVFDAVCHIRSEKLPNPEYIANAGSFFKNPVIEKSHFDKLKEEYPELVGYNVTDSIVKVAAGWLIESCGWKGYLKDGVGVYAKQALVLIHGGNSSIEALLALATEIKASIKTKFDIDLEIEPQHFPMK